MPNKILILGGSSSIGSELIKHLLDERDVVATYRSKSIFLESPHLKNLQLDISDIESINDFLIGINNYEFSEVICFIGSLNGNNFPLPFLQLNDYISTYVTNLIYLMENMFIENRIKNNSRIIMMSSRAAKYGSYDYPYAVVKGALESYVKAKGKLKQSFRIISISTGLILGSKMQEEMPANVIESHMGRAGSNLLTVSSLCDELMKLFNKNDWISGSTVYLGPQYE